MEMHGNIDSMVCGLVVFASSWVSMDASNVFCLRFYFLVEI